MSRRCNSYKKYIFLLILALQLILHVTLSSDNPFWCGKVENEATGVWIGHNFSKRFNLKDPIHDNQILVWTKGNSTWVKRNANPLEYMDDGNYSHTRYRMTQVNEVSFDLFIDYAEENDTGHHVVTLNFGEQSLCTALMMNLSINNPEPICSTRLSKNDGIVQMSCQWAQMNKGDRAHFELEREVLYEHLIQEVNSNGTFSMTHTFSVNLGLDRLVDEITVPPRCVVSQKRGKVTEMCEFLEVSSYPRKYTQNSNVEFKCCAPKPRKPLPLIYGCYGNELPINVKRNYTTKEDKCILFFICGANDGHNSNITVIKIEQLDVRRLIKYESTTLSVEVGEPEHDNEYNNASEDQECEVVTVKVKSPNGTLNNQDGISTYNDISKKCVYTYLDDPVSCTTPTYKPDGITAKYRHILSAAAATAASVLVFITGACITRYYYLYNSSGKHYLVRRDTAGDSQRSPPEAEDDDGVRDRAMTTFISQTQKQDGDAGYQKLDLNQVSHHAGYQSLNFNQPPSDDEVHCFKEESAEPCSGPPSLPLGREMTKHDTGSRPESVKKSSRQQNAPTACKPIPDSTHCSVAMKTFISQTPKQDSEAGYQKLDLNQVSHHAGYQSFNFNQPPSDDEVHCFKEESTEPCSGPPSLPLGREMTKHDTGGRPKSVKKSNGQQNLPTACKPINHESYGKNQLYPSSSGHQAIRDDWKGTCSPTQELHEVYGKSDMNHECFQSINLHEIFPPPPALTTDQAYHVYEKAVASDTDESTSGDELYINTPDPAQELHEVYGKSDMNHECFHSSHLRESFLQPPTLTTDQAYHVYENAVASDADESTGGDELYINTPDPASI